MRRDGNIVQYSAAELDEMIARGEGMTDWDRVDAMTDEEVEANIDYEDEGYPIWATARAWQGDSGFPENLTIQVDRDVVGRFMADDQYGEHQIGSVLVSWILEQARQNAHGAP